MCQHESPMVTKGLLLEAGLMGWRAVAGRAESAPIRGGELPMGARKPEGPATEGGAPESGRGDGQGWLSSAEGL